MLRKNLLQRKGVRLKEYNYNALGVYFLTICTENRKNVLCKIVGCDVLDAPQKIEMFSYGIIAKTKIENLSTYYKNVSIESYVIMPNHLHILLRVYEKDGSSSMSTPTSRQHATVPKIVSAFKRACNKEYGQNIWQRSFYDHVIRNEKDYNEHLKYIQNNPKSWVLDELFKEE